MFLAKNTGAKIVILGYFCYFFSMLNSKSCGKELLGNSCFSWNVHLNDSKTTFVCFVGLFSTDFFTFTWLHVEWPILGPLPFFFYWKWIIFHFLANTDRTLIRGEEGPKCLAAPPTAYIAQTIFSFPVAVDTLGGYNWRHRGDFWIST